jgi:hypothetical protein
MRISYYYKCRLEYVSNDEYEAFCPKCMKKPSRTYKAGTVIKQCSHCGCAPCACNELYSEEGNYYEIPG